MSTLAVVEDVLRRSRVPLTVGEIVRRAGARLPTRSKHPASVVARDLAMDIKRRRELSEFVRVEIGVYTLRELAPDVESVVIDRSRRRWRWSEEARKAETERRARVRIESALSRRRSARAASSARS
jgi:hypothetical protein